MAKTKTTKESTSGKIVTQAGKAKLEEVKASYLDRVYFFKDDAGKFRWHRRTQNGNVLADSGQGYARKFKAMEMARRVNGHENVIYHVELIENPAHSA